MKILKKKIQISKELQKSHIKHMSHPSKKNFQKTQNFENFSDAGLRAKKSPLAIFSLKPKV